MRVRISVSTEPVVHASSPNSLQAMTTPSVLPRLPPLDPVGVCKGLICTLALTMTSVLGSVFMMGPILPLMAVRPHLFRQIADWMMNLWLLLPVVSRLMAYTNWMLHVKVSFVRVVHPQEMEFECLNLPATSNSKCC